LSDKFAVMNALRKKQISGTSESVEKFETGLAKKFDRSYSVAVSNGSVALDLSFQLIDLKEGDEVILPSFTIVSCLSAVLRKKATPVFCDVDPFTWNMTLENVIEKYTNNTKAVLLVHTYGLPAEAVKIEKFCKEKNLICIEDAAEAHGQDDHQKPCGSFGMISTMSFYANKHITSGEGGAILLDSEEMSLKAKQMRNLDFQKNDRFQHNNMYWNYRIGGIQATLGLSQINKLQKTISKKIEQGNNYINLLNEYQELFQLPLSGIRQSKNHFWVFGIVLKIEKIRDRVINQLLKDGIETRPFFYPLHLQPFLKNFKNSKNANLEISKKLGLNGLYIPMGDHINYKVQKQISETLIKTVNKLKNDY
jgi:perosamine synthetase